MGVAADRVLLTGGATRSPALQAIAPTVLPYPVWLPEPGEYVALGAARQAAWALSGQHRAPEWTVRRTGPLPGEYRRFVRDRYESVRDMTANRADVDQVR
jgi:xylulokinase